ncbi:DUF4357 domain-containing protein [Amycolatopsis lexingtonensis]|uniref:DUF4357 domain-containing protein n=1 Tax=Amycolatopsis lexingtonensis TaxID=218822 RepID=UPI003F6FEEA3
MLADGRTFVNPSGALTAVSGKHQNGWLVWKRTSDGRELGELRAELRRHSGVTARPQRGRSR